MAEQQNLQIQPTSKADIIASMKPIFNDLFERCGVPDASIVRILDQELLEPFLLPLDVSSRISLHRRSCRTDRLPALASQPPIYVTLYMTLCASMDDLSLETGPEFVESFNEWFIHGFSQGHPGASEALAVISREAVVN
ncbi:hypothetical protein PQX77_012364 [Marasmius sp. AFHP31]|nr:hypothetical protein PQX77_012364 [Marasmius sp. AFHP31]